MPRTIGKRIQRTVLLAVLLTLAVTIASVYVANESLEQSVLQLDLQAERDFLIGNARQGQPLVWDTASLKAYYAPPGVADDAGVPLPAVFDGLPFPFSGEIEMGAATFLVTVGEAAGGRLYIAKDITLFEQRETEFLILLALISVAVVGAGLLLGWLTSRRLVQPLQQLASHIGATQPAPSMPRVSLSLQDRELREIADTFDRFLDEMEAYVRREKSLLSLASHELRTPVAVIGGALDVIDQRARLGADDARTLARVRRANDEMGRNVETILRLTRRPRAHETQETVALATVVRDVCEDLARVGVAAQGRVQVDAAHDCPVQADPTLAKMLVRNLVQNALQHTSGDIVVTVRESCLEVADRGEGLSLERQACLARAEPPGHGGGLTGLGLFIVTLVCEKLDWHLSVVQATPAGTTLRVRWAQPGMPGVAP